MATPDTWLDLGLSRAATSGLVRGTATHGPTAEQRTAARPRSSQVSQRPVDVAPLIAYRQGVALSLAVNRLIRASASALVAAGLALVGTATPARAEASTPATATTVLNGVDLDQATVLSLQEDMNALRLSSVRLTAFYLVRIHLLNPTLHAVLEVNPDALAA